MVEFQMLVTLFVTFNSTIWLNLVGWR